MRYSFSTILIFFFLTETFAPKLCGYWRPRARIISGVDMQREDYPPFFCSLVRYEQKDLNEVKPSCGCTMITDKHAITAAHCFYSVTEDTTHHVSLYVGICNMANRCNTTGSVQSAVETVYIYPSFNKVSLAGDIAIIKFENSMSVGYICIAQGDIPTELKYLDFAGFGVTDASSTAQPCKIQTNTLDICTEEETKASIIAPYLNLLPDYITTGCKSKGKDTCQGDSGGPAYFGKNRYYLVGIVSFGISCGENNSAGVNSLVANTEEKRNWILEVTQS